LRSRIGFTSSVKKLAVSAGDGRGGVTQPVTEAKKTLATTTATVCEANVPQGFVFIAAYSCPFMVD
jgi:hypothetical protein